jgi:hypothetical protein
MRESLTLRDGTLLVSAAVGGELNVTGPRRINAQALTDLTTKAGLTWRTTFNPENVKARPTIRLGMAQSWQPPRTAPEASTSVEAVQKWVALQQSLRVAETITDDRSSGSVICIAYQAHGELTSGAILDALKLPNVVNIWVYGHQFEVYLARNSQVEGGLQHLSSTSAIRARLGKPRRAGKVTHSVRRRRRKRGR